jgi:hypothetical protein
MNSSHPSSGRRWRWILAVAIVLWPAAWGFARDKNPSPPPAGFYIELSEDFYRALNQAGNDEGGRLSNRPMSEEYLHQIAVSAKFMVETNLQLMRQQERMLQLLEEIRDKSGKK